MPHSVQVRVNCARSESETGNERVFTSVATSGPRRSPVLEELAGASATEGIPFDF